MSISDLIGEPILLDWTVDSRSRTVPALREALMDYSQLSPLLAGEHARDDQPGLQFALRCAGTGGTA